MEPIISSSWAWSLRDKARTVFLCRTKPKSEDSSPGLACISHSSASAPTCPAGNTCVLSGRESSLDYWGNKKKRFIIVPWLFFQVLKILLKAIYVLAWVGKECCALQYPGQNFLSHSRFDKRTENFRVPSSYSSSHPSWSFLGEAAPRPWWVYQSEKLNYKGREKLLWFRVAEKNLGKEFHDTICNF